MDMKDSDLFSDTDDECVFTSRRQRVCDSVDAFNEKRLMDVPVGVNIGTLFKEYKIETPHLHEDKITVGSRETKIDMSGNPLLQILDRSRPTYVDHLIIEADIPFSGDSAMFWVKPSKYTSRRPRGRILRNNILRVSSIVANVDANAKDIRSDIDTTVECVKKYLDWLHADVDSYNKKLDSLICERITERRNRILRNQGILSSLGYPVRNKDK